MNCAVRNLLIRLGKTGGAPGWGGRRIEEIIIYVSSLARVLILSLEYHGTTAVCLKRVFPYR